MQHLFLFKMILFFADGSFIDFFKLFIFRIKILHGLCNVVILCFFTLLLILLVYVAFGDMFLLCNFIFVFLCFVLALLTQFI